MKKLLDDIEPEVTDEQRAQIDAVIAEKIQPRVETFLEKRASMASKLASDARAILSEEQIASLFELRDRFSAEKRFFDTLGSE